MDNKNIVYNFSAYLEEISGVPSYINKIDAGANDYPMWNIEFDDTWNFKSMDDTNGSLDLTVKVSLYTDLKNTDTMLSTIFKTLKKINKFDYSGGSLIGKGEENDTGTGDAELKPERTENSLILSFPYTLKAMVQDT